MSVKMSNKSKLNNGVNETGPSSEGLSPGRCPIGEQDGPVVLELLLIGVQREENGLKKEQSSNVKSMGEMDTGRECMP